MTNQKQNKFEYKKGYFIVNGEKRTMTNKVKKQREEEARLKAEQERLSRKEKQLEKKKNVIKEYKQKIKAKNNEK